MEVERKGKEIVANLTREDVFDLQAGKTIYGKNKTHGDRPAVTMPDANFEVLPLSYIELDDSLKDKWAIDRLKKAKEAQLKAYLFSNGDLQVFIPAITLSDVRLENITLFRESIETPGTEDGKSLVEHVIPKEGIRLNFVGSLKILNIPDFFYRGIGIT